MNATINATTARQNFLATQESRKRAESKMVDHVRQNMDTASILNLVRRFAYKPNEDTSVVMIRAALMTVYEERNGQDAADAIWAELGWT